MRAFLAVIRAGSLREAAQTTGLSAATLGRRITALERASGLTLVSREASGYQLTEAGRTAIVVAERMAAAADDLERLGRARLPLVRVAAGSWMARFLAVRAASLAGTADDFAIEWVAGTERADIARREAHVGIRNARPTSRELAGRRLGTVSFAVYRRDGTEDAANGDWLLAGTAPLTPSAKWTLAQPGRVAARVSDASLLLPLIAAGTGRAVLPCFVGDQEAGLVRDSEPIAELAHEQWLVAHHDDRHLPAVRRVIERIVALVGDEADRFSGRRGHSGPPP